MIAVSTLLLLAAGNEVCSLLPPDDERSRPPKDTAALILVDRSLDLLTPGKHHDHFLDRIFGVLPRTEIGGPVSSSERCKHRSASTITVSYQAAISVN